MPDELDRLAHDLEAMRQKPDAATKARIRAKIEAGIAPQPQKGPPRDLLEGRTARPRTLRRLSAAALVLMAAFGALVALMVAQPGLSTAQPGPLMAQQPTPHPGLEALVEQVAPHANFYVGVVPSRISQWVDLPPGATLYGTVTTSGADYDVYLHSDLPPAEIATFYADYFTGLGMEPQRERSYPRFVAHPEDLAQVRAYCSGDFAVRVFVTPGGVTQLNYFTPGNWNVSRCTPPRLAGSPDVPAAFLQIAHPPGYEMGRFDQSFINAEHSNGNDTIFFLNVTFALPNADPAAILAHYDAQITAYGWERVAQSDTSMTWFIDDVRRGKWELTFTLALQPTGDTVFLGVTSERIFQ